MRVGTLRRAAVVAAAVTAAVVGAGCVGGNAFGANPGDGGCGFRPDGLVVEDITGVWQGNGVTVTLKLDGTVTGPARLLPPTGRPTTVASGPGAPVGTTVEATVEATGRWTLRAGTHLGDIDITDVTSARGPASFGVSGFYVSGTRRRPWLYTLGEGDPDSCDIITYERTSRG